MPRVDGRVALVTGAGAWVARPLGAEGAARESQVRRADARPDPSGSWAEPAEVAGAFAFLASDNAAYITGQVLWVDGGTVI